LPPPADVIDEKIEALPTFPGDGLVAVPAPPAPTVIGKDVAVTERPPGALNGLAV
tara:strand:- start:78 stop:242 length:165 start_codon:yes stop_codon:yes gene_type:complete